jgi:sulfur carrier protein ThiS
VEDFYRAKGAHLNTMLSGSCPPEQNAPRTPRLSLVTPATIPGATPDGDKPVRALGVENAVRTFSEESQLTGGLFSFQPEVKQASDADAQERYSNTLANLGISAVRPAVAAVNPAAVPRSTALDVELTGSTTNFRAGSTVAVAGSGVTASAVRVLSPTRIVVRLAATSGATLGFRDVTVSTALGSGTTETATGIGAVRVTPPPSGPAILSVTPSTGGAGSTENVTISGGLTHFGAGSLASFGAGVTVNHLTVTSPTAAVANVTAAPAATIGFRSVTVTTGGEAPTRANAFLVTAPAPPFPRLASASPRSGARGATIAVTLTGANTAFVSGTSLASASGTGVQVLSTTVRSPTVAVARLKIAPNAPLGFRDLRVATGAQDAALLDGFEVTPKPSGGGGPPTTCSDHALPSASLLKGKRGAKAKKRKLQLHGHAHDDGCVSVAGKVARVDVAISRKAGTQCRFVSRSGTLTTARKCSKPVFLKAKGTTSWSLTTKRKLPKGTYTILVRVRDAAGNLRAKAAKRALRLK